MRGTVRLGNEIFEGRNLKRKSKRPQRSTVFKSALGGPRNGG